MNALSNIGTIKEILTRHGFTFSKALGQNFLINPSVCPRMAQECGADEHTGVLEVGPGIGVLTVELAARAKKVVAVELDDRLLPVLAETLAEHPNASVIRGDILKLDLHGLIEREFVGMDVVVCANLPYYITSPVIMALDVFIPGSGAVLGGPTAETGTELAACDSAVELELTVYDSVPALPNIRQPPVTTLITSTAVIICSPSRFGVEVKILRNRCRSA